MKRFLIVLMVLGLLVGTVVTAEAKGTNRKRVERTVDATYGPFVAPVTGCNDPGGSLACIVVNARSTEAFLTAKVTDAHGQPVFVQVSGGTRATFCGETTRPISFDPGSRLEFRIDPMPYFWSNWGLGWVGPLDCPYRIKTTGTISVTLSNVAPMKAEPVRSGSILSGTGWLGDYQMGGCQVSPECAAWLQNDCADALVGHDPGLTASILNIDELAGGPPVERVFRFRAGEPWSPVFGGVHLQFWSSDCVEIPDTRWRSTDCDGDASGRDCTRLRFLMPPTAKWMTVTGYQDNVNLVWTLT